MSQNALCKGRAQGIIWGHVHFGLKLFMVYLWHYGFYIVTVAMRNGLKISFW